MGFKESLITFGKKTLFNAKKYSPEIMAGGAIVLGIGTVVATWIAARKHDEVMAEPKKMIETAKSMELSETYTKKDRQHDIFLGYVKGAAAIVKLYGPAALMGSASIACGIGSYKVLAGRNAGLVAANTILGKELDARDNYILEKYGQEELDKMRLAGKTETVTETVTDENGEEKTVEKVVPAKDYEKNTLDRFFDEFCTRHTKDPVHNIDFLKNVQTHMNMKLKQDHVLFLNEVYEEIGLPKTQAGYQYGWVYCPGESGPQDGVELGLPLGDREWRTRMEKNNEYSYLLHFNCKRIVWSETPFQEV